MKILVIQLARFGDIYMTWPAIRAIKRLNPKAEVHMLCRSRFIGATEGMESLDHIWELDTKSFIEPLMRDDGIEKSLEVVQEFLSLLGKQNFDWIVNFTFSPLSSFLTHAITGPNCRVSGFSRDQNGDLFIADNISEYFYSQVGIDKFNRIHLTDIFAGMIGIDYYCEDWRGPKTEATINQIHKHKQSVIVHLGASKKEKAIPGYLWARIIRTMVKKNSQLKIIIVGGAEDRQIANEVLSQIETSAVEDFVGKTKLRELFDIIASCDLLIGCDSAPIHMASLTDTAVYNLSFGNVNFWETGPKSTRAFIERFTQIAEINSESIADNALQILQGASPVKLISRHEGLESYIAPQSHVEAFAWDFIKALYFGESLPICDDYEFYEAAVKVYDTVVVVLNGIKNLAQVEPGSLGHIIDTSDEILKKIASMVPKIAPLIWWLEGQKVRIAPGNRNQIINDNIKVYKMMSEIMRMYIPKVEEQGGPNGSI